MASIGRIHNVSKLIKCNYLPKNSCLRLISTSKKNRESTSVVNPPAETSYEESTQPKTKKYFYNYGFGGKTEEEEHNHMHSVFFFSVTIGLTLGAFSLAYQPDLLLNDWAHREGYLELRRREKLGLPLIDPNYVDPAQVQLPSDEELGDTEIII